MCGRAVCAACSPNTVKLHDDGKAQRACKDCLGSIGKLPEMAARLTNISSRLNNLCMFPAGTPESMERPGNFEAAVTFCESTITALEREEDRLQVTQKKVELLQVEERVARASCVRLVQRIYALQQTKPPADLQTASLDEALVLCEAALIPLEDRRLGCSERVTSGTSEASCSQMHEGSRSQPCTESWPPLRASSSSSSSPIGTHRVDAQQLLPQARCLCNCRWRCMLGLVMLALMLMLLSACLLVYFRVLPMPFANSVTSTITKMLLDRPKDSLVNIGGYVVFDASKT